MTPPPRRSGRGAGLRHLWLPVLLSGVAGAVVADELRPAPEYFVHAMTSITTAENIATVCPGLTFDTAGAAAMTTDVLHRLAVDGFDAKNLETTMADPGDAVRAAQAAFRTKHALSPEVTDFEAVCAAGAAEMAEASAIGQLLIEITGTGAVDPTQSDAPQ